MIETATVPNGRRRPPPRPQGGFTLIELMITVAIVAILAAIAYPAYTEQVAKSRRAEAKAMLMEVMGAQERFYSLNSTYTTSLTATLGYPDAGGGAVASEEDHYRITAAACGGGIGSCVQLTATPQIADARCGNLTLDSTGVRGESGTSTIQECW